MVVEGNLISQPRYPTHAAYRHAASLLLAVSYPHVGDQAHIRPQQHALRVEAGIDKAKSLQCRCRLSLSQSTRVSISTRAGGAEAASRGPVLTAGFIVLRLQPVAVSGNVTGKVSQRVMRVVDRSNRRPLCSSWNIAATFF